MSKISLISLSDNFGRVLCFVARSIDRIPEM